MNLFRKKNPDSNDTPQSARLIKADHPAVPKPRGQVMGWALRRIRNHVTFTENRMIAWYVLDPQMWSFRSVSDGEGLITSAASQIAELTGRTIYGRVTTRPYPVAAWAKASWENAPAPSQGYVKILERDQMQLARRMQADKLVYFGVDLGARSVLADLTSRVMSDVSRRELEQLQAKLEETDVIMAGPGIEATPALGDDMAWLLARSFALGCPVPLPEHTSTTQWEDPAEFTAGVEWSAEPLAASVRVDSAMNPTPTTRHVVVLSVGRMADLQIPERDEPWIAKTDKLRFPVEWSFRVDVQTPDQTSREMNKLADRVHAQIDHYEKDHGKTPPKQLARQAARTAQVEDEMRAGFDGLNTRVRGWFRIAVSGETETEALKRAAEVQNLFKPAIKIERELDQYRLAREFVPGEPLANSGHTRRMPVLKLAAGVPAATAEVGDKRGVLIGYTSGFSERAVTWDPHFGPEVVEGSGLVPIIGGLGSGKSTLAGTVIYKTAASGVPWTVMDPSGMLSTLADLPEFKGVSQAVNLLHSERGALNPYALVPDPHPEWHFGGGVGEMTKGMLGDISAAEAQRRDLMYEALRWCLPPRTADREDVQNILLDAVQAAPAKQHSTAEDVLRLLERLGAGDEVAALVLRRLREAAERELSRLFFATESDGNHGENVEQRRLTVMSLKGLATIDESKPRNEWSYEELMSRPILSMAAWSALRSVYRADRNERKGIFLDEAHEITKVSTGATLTQKIATDSRKHNLAALLATQNAQNILNMSSNINALVGAAFVGRTTDETAQAANCRILGLPTGQGYEAVFGRLSMRSRRQLQTGTPREFLFRDGMGGESGRGGLEKVRIDISNHPGLISALNTTADPAKRASAARDLHQVDPDDVDAEEHAA